MTVSSSMHGGTSSKSSSVVRLMYALSIFHQALGRLFQEAFPQEHARYLSTWHAAKSHLPDASNGPWLGKAILWKLQTFLHTDVIDGPGGICGIFNGGQYIHENDDGLGTALLLPDLGYALQ